MDSLRHHRCYEHQHTLNTNVTLDSHFSGQESSRNQRKRDVPVNHEQHTSKNASKRSRYGKSSWGAVKPARVPERPKLFLACPFHKYDPAKYCITRNTGRYYKACTVAYDSFHHLVDHLYKRRECHAAPIHCERCFTEFESDLELDMHIEADTECVKVRPAKRYDGITRLQIRKLNREIAKVKSDEEKWKILFKLLFPHINSVPSPYHEPVVPQALTRTQIEGFIDLYERENRSRIIQATLAAINQESDEQCRTLLTSMLREFLIKFVAEWRNQALPSANHLASPEDHTINENESDVRASEVAPDISAVIDPSLQNTAEMSMSQISAQHMGSFGCQTANSPMSTSEHLTPQRECLSEQMGLHLMGLEDIPPSRYRRAISLEHFSEIPDVVDPRDVQTGYAAEEESETLVPWNGNSLNETASENLLQSHSGIDFLSSGDDAT